ncbi:type II toxin-antitoxin system RelE/ParE family toxin [Flavobacterium sp. CLA17]|uniref:type II toxin-antitoxin system RelE/ParE family toxin n=1 Tax=Flavobacterium sp. CLA17 TaxID=2724135 RepID=UPI0014913C38|nr:type II toxin-antitoxin system RelE/ParE family toxin [Flavobacterium sp. CLA17]QSB27223.1 type II toxin-antitoxin system RelE/ParE family toxin [Flavobacterium sp. CLA17]
MVKIIWTDIAKIDYWKNIEYLESDWTLQDVYNFIEKTDHLIELLTYQVSVTKQITLYYKVSEDSKIELLRFWNTYQNPKKFIF